MKKIDIKLPESKLGFQAYMEYMIFDEPSGEVRGMLTAMVKGNKGKSTRVGQATFLVGQSPDISLKLPSGLGLEDIAAVISAIEQFKAKALELDQSK